MAKIGIDFGTTNSLIVAYDRDEHEFYYFKFDDMFGDTPIPTSSTVMYHGNNIVVGSKARQKINLHGGDDGYHFEKSIKLKLGQENGIDKFGENIPPYLIAADIIDYIKKFAEKKEMENPKGINFNRAVFTVPVDFKGTQRRSLRKAAAEAGIGVTTFIHEPFAAIIGYFFTKEDKSTIEEVFEDLNTLNGKFLLTFDWGGGTLDITVVKVENGKMIEKGTAELTDKAGDKFDEEIAVWAWDKFESKYKDKYPKAILNQKKKDNWDKILAMAEQCKIILSNKDVYQAPFRVRDIFEDIDIIEEITRSDFEGLIENIILDASDKIDEAMKAAGISANSISQVLLTGGTCNIPVIKTKLRNKFGHKVNRVKNADLLIAQGAAVISEMEWIPFLSKDISIQLSDDSYHPIFKEKSLIAIDGELQKSLDLVCCDNRGGKARIIIVESVGKVKSSALTTIEVPVRNITNFKDRISLNASIDKDIVLTVKAHNLAVDRGGNSPNLIENEVNQLCFGLDFKKPS